MTISNILSRQGNLVSENNVDFHTKNNSYEQTLVHKNLGGGIVPVLEGIDAIVGIAGGVINILQSFGVLPSEESKNFEKVFDALGKNYAAIEEVGEKVDRNYAAMKAVYEIARQTLFDIEETRFEMRLGFQCVLDSISKLRVDDKVSKITTFISDFFTNDIHIINKLSREERFAKLKELSKAITTSGGVLHDNLNDIIEQGLAIPDPNSAGDSAANNAKFAALHTVYYGTQVCVSVVFFVIEQYSYLAGDYYHSGEIEKYNELYSSLQAEFAAFKGTLLKKGGMIDNVSVLLTTVKNLPLVINEREDILDLLSERITSLGQVKDKLEHMVLPIVTIKPSKIMGVPNFSMSNISTPIGQWKDYVKVSYAVQFRYNSTYSQVGEWSDSVVIHGKANPFLIIPAAGEVERERLIFRKFGGGKAELVGEMKEKDKLSFRDISRDVYDAALSTDEDRARNEIKSLLRNDADINATFDNGRKAIHAAAQSNNFNITLDLLKLNTTDINVQDANGYTPIYIAAEAGYVDFVKSLLDHGADPNIKTNLSDLTLTPLHIAAYKGFFPVVEILMLSNETDVNSKDMNGFTPLHSATFSDSYPSISALLNSNNTDVNAKSKQGLTPLHLTAINKRHADAAKVLLKSNRADINAEAKGNLTALHFAASIGNLEAAKVIIEHNGTDLNAKSADNFTPLHFATSLKKDHVALELLNARGIEVNAKGKGDITPLHIAAVTGQTNLTSTLLEKGALTEEKTKDGLTALHSTAMYDKYEIIPILLDNGANIEAMTVNGSTPLHLASFAGNKNATLILLDKGADIKVYDGHGQMPVHLAILKDRKGTVKTLIERDVDLANITNKNGEYPIHLAARYLDLVKYLADEVDVDVNVKDRKDYTPLHYAARYGQLGVIEYLINLKNVEFKVKGIDGKSPLHLAAEGGHLDVVKYLIDNKGVDVNMQDNHRKTCLHLAAENGQLNVVKYLSNEKNVDIYLKDSNHNCALHLAAKNDKLNILKYFIDEKHAQINVRGFSDKHLLHFAAESGSLDVLGYLVNKKKCDVNVRDSDDNVPLHMASKNDHIEIIEALLDKGAQINAVNRWKETPIHIASEHGYLGITKYLTEKGAGVNLKDSVGRTPLHLAAEGGHLDIVKYLVDEKGANVNVKDNYGRTSLHLAAKGGHLDTVKYLADEKGADVNVNDNDGRTSLHLAAEGGHLDTVKYLVDEKRFDANVKDNDGLTPLYFAAESGKWDVIRYLVSKNPDVNIRRKDGKTCLYFAAEKGNLDIVKLLVEKGADVNLKDNYGMTPLHLAAKKGDLDTVKFLVEEGAKINERDDSPWYGGTPLNYAAEYGFIDIVKYLVTHGANVNAKDVSGTSTLHCAVVSGNLEIIKLLVKNKADVNVRGMDGRTPLFNSAVSCELDIVKFLSENGAKVNTRDDLGYTPVSFITSQIIPRLSPRDPGCYLDVVKYLKSRGIRRLEYFIDKIERGDGVNAQDKEILLHYSADDGYLDVVRYLKSKDDRTGIGNENSAVEGNRATSGSSRSSSWINNLFVWAKSSIGELFYSQTALPEGSSFTTKCSLLQVNAPTDVNGTVMLLDLLVRKVTNQKYISSVENSISLLEAQGFALNVSKGFEKVVEQALSDSKISMHRLNIDFMEIQKILTAKIISGKFNEISGILKSRIEKACPGREAGCPDKLSPKKFDKFITKFNNKLDITLNKSIQQILHYENNILKTDNIKESRNLGLSGPRTRLDDVLPAVNARELALEGGNVYYNIPHSI